MHCKDDFDVTGLGYKKSVIPGMETSVFTADTELVEMAKEACEIVNPEIQCFVGRVVTGDQFISDNGTKVASRKRLRWILCRDGRCIYGTGCNTQ